MFQRSNTLLLFRSKIEDKLRMVEEGGSKNDLEKTINDLEQNIQDLEEKNNELGGSVRIYKFIKFFILMSNFFQENLKGYKLFCSNFFNVVILFCF